MSAYDTLAAVDLGSNSFRLEVARVAGDQLYPLDALKETVRLAGGLGDDKLLDDATQQRALACLHRFGERLRGLPAGAVRCVGTSALRVARNAPAFLQAAEAALGHSIEVVAGREEARLIYLGVAHSLPKTRLPRLVVDIGGGSTEFIVGIGIKPMQCESLHMGCVNFSQRFFPNGVITKAAMKAAELAARVEVERIASEFDASNWRHAIGSSGSARALRDLLELNAYSAQGITADGLDRLRSEMIRAGHVDRISLAGLRADRRPVAAGGFAIMAGIFAELDITQMQVVETAMRDGLLYDLLGRTHKHDMREVTVDEYMRRYHVDAPQAARVARVAGKLLRAAGERPGDDEDGLDWRYLNWAARLHEIGLSISHSGYHRHSGYILENADMPGFSRSDQACIALLVRAQRGALNKVPRFAEAGAHVADRDTWLVWLLRQAVILCRSRSEPRLTGVRVEYAARRYRLQFPDGWLARRPLTQKALEVEAGYWKGLGVEYGFG
jgi:exopolyphosphatase/guanosine-5'-triphosphate,3'-diphosphate pyrophosphatase